MEFLRWLFDAQIAIGDSQYILVREVLGNFFGLLSALGGMRRKIWAWPVGIVGNLILLTVFLGTFFGTDFASANLLGQAGRQIMFIAVAIWGWRRWYEARDKQPNHNPGAITPRFATWKERLFIISFLVLGTAILTPIFRLLGSYEPVWSDAWIFTGSILATLGMAKGWVEFWLVWVAVDVVGVPLLWSAGYYASAFMYLFYGVFTLTGFFIWWRTKNQQAKLRIETAFPDPTVDVIKDANLN